MTVFEIAYRLLGQYESSGTYINLSLNSHLADGLSKKDRAVLTALLYKTVEKKLTYDYYISSLASRSIDKLSPEVRDALRLGICAICDMKSIPDHAAVNEAVKLVGHKGERSLVNAILRRVSRERDALPLPDKSKNAARYYSVYYSIPLSTVKYFISLLGEESAVAFFESVNSQERKTTITVNTNEISVSDLAEKLRLQGYNVAVSKYSPISLCLSGSHDPRQLVGFNDGEFFVQDEASVLSALVLGAKKGEVLLDLCAAPGGKSFALAILSENGAEIHSFDIHDSKLSLINSGAERLGLNSVSAEVGDASVLNEELIGKADRVLCDVPCSGLGVLSKKPDLRYKDITALESLSALQKKILSTAAAYLKVGGELVYSTCTLRKEENGDVLEAFLLENPDFEAVDFSFGEIKSENGRVTLYPHIHGTDGFFISKLRKKK